MINAKTSTIAVCGTSISIVTGKDGDCISLTDMLRAEDREFFISDWLRKSNTVKFLGVWEGISNPGFDSLEFEGIRNEAGRSSLFPSSKNGAN